MLEYFSVTEKQSVINISNNKCIQMHSSAVTNVSAVTES